MKKLKSVGILTTQIRQITGCNCILSFKPCSITFLELNKRVHSELLLSPPRRGGGGGRKGGRMERENREKAEGCLLSMSSLEALLIL